jgi:hypothetical protein
MLKSQSQLKNKGKARHQGTTENRHIGHCTHTWDSKGKGRGKVFPLQARFGPEGG